MHVRGFTVDVDVVADIDVDAAPGCV